MSKQKIKVCCSTCKRICNEDLKIGCFKKSNLMLWWNEEFKYLEKVNRKLEYINWRPNNNEFEFISKKEMKL